MGYRTPDVYHQPEHFGLTPIGSIDDPNASYSFDDLIVWQHTDGRIFWAQDAGCSCPSPFEDFTSLNQLNLVTEDTWGDFEAAVREHCAPYDWESRTAIPESNPAQWAEKVELLSKVSKALRG
jgi:hypothetical protein